ncbi:hypothetical protein BGX23_011662 [Mortierella sp. AD031]|nr:hypothetical protein BGX23_011662 [Mortierella sp. AD031]
MMLNLTGVFSGKSSSSASSTQLNNNSSTANGAAVQSQQPPATTTTAPVEAQLWNADWVEPASPALPRYIPAIAGKGAVSPNPRMATLSAGTGGGAGGGRFNSGWSNGVGAGMGRKSGEGAGWRTAGQGPTASSSLDKPSPESSHSFKTRAGYIPNGSGQPVMTQQQQSMLSPGLRRNQPLQQRAGGDGAGAGDAGEGSLEMSWIGGEGADDRYDGSSNMRGFRRDYDDDDEDDYKDRKKDRSHYTRREHGHQRQSYFPLLFSDSKRVLRARLFCLRQNRRLHPCIRLVVFLFLAGSVCFTTIQLLFLGGGGGGDGSAKTGLRKSFDYTEQELRVRKMLGRSRPQKRILSSFDVEAQNYSIHQWAVDTYDIKNTKAIARVGEDYMLSKAFNSAMQPSRVIPFYFKASFRDKDDDEDLHVDDHHGTRGSESDAGPQAPVKLDPSLVTITTLITPDRYGVFLKLVRQYRGPISVATHIRKGPDQDAMFHELHAFFRDNSILRKYVDLHVIVDGVDFQLNMWRNVARMFARTDYFMMLDVDFHIPSSLKRNLHYDIRIQELLASGAALVVPAFEYKVEHDPKDSKYFPDTKADLLPLLDKEHITVFHDSFPPGHGATDTPRWMKMSQGHSGQARSPPKGRAGFEEDYDGDLFLHDRADAGAADAGLEADAHAREEYLEHEASGERPYKVTKFEPKYEPYIILKKEGTPWCDERFVGYGANKAACLFEIYISGIDFWVMPQDFLIHQYHDYPTTDRKNGRILNKQLFVSFQQEICFRTLDRMIVTGEWYTSKADNLRHQCSDFEGFLQSADQMAREFEERHPNSLLKDPVFVTEQDEMEASRPRRGARQGSQDDKAHSHERGGRGEVALGQQVVDTEQYQDPWMSRPQGKIWGGVQPRTFYVPPPSEDEIPIDGIGIDAAIEGTPVEDHDSSPFSFEEAEKVNDANSHNNDLTGDRLERFREGIILSPPHDQEQDGDRRVEANPRRDEEDEEREADGSIPGSVNSGDNGGSTGSSVPRHSGSPPSNAEGKGSFMDEAEKLEQKFRINPS